MNFNRLQLPLSRSAIGLDKLGVRAKGINHPKYSVKPEYACSKHESARPAVTFTGEGKTTEVNGVKKGLAEPYADTRLILTLPVDMAVD